MDPRPAVEWRIAKCPHCGEELSVAASRPAVGGEGLDMERLAKVLRHHVTMIAGTSTEELAEAIAAEYAALAAADKPDKP